VSGSRVAERRAGPPTRRRGSKLESALLQAAWDELTEVGYAALTMEGVAVRANTSRAVPYRRWPNRPELVVAALRHHTAMAPLDLPDTGVSPRIATVAVDLVRHDLIMTQAPVPDETLVEIVDKIFLPLVGVA
jgi:AcrR family transcriptional regulator